MIEPIIQARDLGIFFPKGSKKKGRLKDLLVRRSKHDNTPGQDFWPLRHVNFDIFPGESVGIIGSNGTGKSTLLRLITGVLIPDEGYVRREGRVAPLIALSAGFSGDLTGRENVNLVGSMHGMSRKEIRDKFDDIVDFAELEDFIDTPVKHYSSGMKVRLGFALITQLPHPILLVDEALAVGDRAFKEKCRVVIQSLLDEGRTLVFVSHSPGDLRRYCKRGIYLSKGEVITDGTVDEALKSYDADTDAKQAEQKRKRARVAARNKAKAEAEAAQAAAAGVVDMKAG
ncbi:ABC transporter ATP-binding protein [Salininema proteolyticum]|uniref:ABC transporter ATP-binding protein n=1 Tax=Salininema proteolyticum TaxID=1607685 RepID=A0ABV8U2G4_9ACTN